MSLLSNLLIVFFPAMLIFAAVSDLMTMTIPNRISLILLAAFPLAAFLGGLDLGDVGLHAATGFAVLLLGFGMFAANWIGGGDAKFAAVIALWFGPIAVLEWTVLFALFGGGLTFILLATRRMPLPVALAGYPWISRLHDPRTGVPYGIALSAAGLMTFPHTALFLALV